MTPYADQIVTPTELKASYLRRLYARINRGLSDSYQQGYALLSNHWAMTPDGPTHLSHFNQYDLPLVKQWLEESGYALSRYESGSLFKARGNIEIWRVTWTY